MTLKSTTMLTKPSMPSSQDWKPKPYMRKAVKFLLQHACAGLFLDPGLGKTSISLAAIKVFLKENLIDFALIIAPLRVIYSVWPKERSKWTDFSDMTVSILHGDKKEKALDTEADLYLINPEGLDWLLHTKVFKKKFKGQALFVDESSKFKNTNTKRFRMLRPKLPLFGRRYVLTGSPAPNGLLDLFGQIFIIDLGEALGEYITDYRTNHFYQTGFMGYEWKLQEGHDKIIHKAIKPITLSMSAEDYLDLPQLVINPVYVDLTGEARRIYEEMEDDLLARIENREVMAASAAVASGKCSQIANGGIYDKEGNAHFIHDLKTEAVAEIVHELNGSPALIAYEYGHDLERLRTVLGKSVPYIGGGVSTKRSTLLEEQWNRGELPVLLGQPASIAHGLNIQEAGNHVIWHSLTWNFEFYDQFIKRVLRQGNKNSHVFVHHIIARGTVDELKLQALNNKFRTQKDLFEALKVFLREKRDNSKRNHFTSAQQSGMVGELGNSAVNIKGGTTMSKFSKKATAEKAAPEAKRPKLWTNNPDWQDQETGETTAEGRAQIAKKGTKGSAKEEAAEAPAKGKAKAIAKTKPAANTAKGKAPAKKAAAAGTRGSSLNDKKIKVLNKKHDAREGTKRAELFDAVLSSKTVGQAREKVEGIDGGCLRIMEDLGLIKLED